VGRPPLPLGTSGTILFATMPNGRVKARVKFRDWDGEVGLITDVVRRRAADLAGADAYVCGPPPMVEAALELLPSLGVEEKRVFYDKFTTTGDPEGP